MLRKIILVIILAHTLLLVSCESSSKLPAKSNLDYLKSSNEKAEIISKKNPFAYPGNFSSPTPYLHTEDGLYEIKPIFNGSCNILYYDYKLRKQIFLCEKPECVHNNENCTSWIKTPEQESFSPLLLCVGEKLLLVKSATSQAGAPYIITMNKNGSNRQTIFSLPSTQRMGRGFISDGANLFFTIEALDTSLPPKNNLVKMEVSTGKLETLISLPHTNLHITGFDDETLYLQTMGQYVEVYGFSPSVDTQLNPIYEWDAQNIPGMLVENHVYLIQQDNTISKINLSMLEQKNIAVPAVPEGGYPGLIYAFDKSVLLEFIIPNDTGVYSSKRYLINIDDNVLAENTLKMQNDHKPIMIIGTYNEYLCVQKGLNETTWLTNTEDGLSIEVFDLVREYALILKSDYIANVPNYLAFQITQ